MDMLISGAKRFAARRHDLHPRCATTNCDGNGGRCVNDVLAIVEHEHHLLVAQGGDHTGERGLVADFETEYRGKCGGHKGSIPEWRQVDPPDPMVVVTYQVVGNGEGDRGLANPSWANDGKKPVLRQKGRQLTYHVAAPNQSCQLSGQIVRALPWGDRRYRWAHLLGPHGLRDKGVNPSRDRGNIAVADVAIPQCLA